MKLILVALFAVVATAENRQCVPNSIFYEYCNACFCSSDGLSAECTKVECKSDGWNEDGTLKPIFSEKSEKICEPYAAFKDYCNKCTCSSDGKSKSCTLMYCDKRIWNQDGTLKFRTGTVVDTEFL